MSKTIRTSEKIKVYDKGVVVRNNPESLYKMLVSYRSGDMSGLRKLDVSELCGLEAQHFADCIQTGKTPITDGHAGLRVVSALEAASLSLAQRGRSVVWVRPF